MRQTGSVIEQIYPAFKVFYQSGDTGEALASKLLPMIDKSLEVGRAACGDPDCQLKSDTVQSDGRFACEFFMRHRLHQWGPRGGSLRASGLLKQNGHLA